MTTDDREQWRARILRALEELQPNDLAQDSGPGQEERVEGAAE